MWKSEFCICKLCTRQYVRDRILRSLSKLPVPIMVQATVRRRVGDGARALSTRALTIDVFKTSGSQHPASDRRRPGRGGLPRGASRPLWRRLSVFGRHCRLRLQRDKGLCLNRRRRRLQHQGGGFALPRRRATGWAGGTALSVASGNLLEAAEAVGTAEARVPAVAVIAGAGRRRVRRWRWWQR